MDIREGLIEILESGEYGITQTTLSRDTGISRQCLNDFLRGRKYLSGRNLERVLAVLPPELKDYLVSNLRPGEITRGW